MTMAGPLLAEDQDRPYEYRRFAVGDRVICQPSPECRAKFKSISRPSGIVTGPHVGHDIEQYGRTGTISEWPPGFIGGRGNHPYRVVYDKPYVGPDGHQQASAGFASAELEAINE